MPEPVVEAKEEAPAPKAAKEDILSLGNKESMSLDEFQTAVKKLKSMLDGGVISDAEFAEEKKKLMKSWLKTPTKSPKASKKFPLFLPEFSRRLSKARRMNSSA